MVFIYITNPDEETAKKIAHHLLNQQLIACGNIFPIQSIYRWEGKVQEDSEVVLIAKSEDQFYEKICEEVKKMHPYDVPCICKIPVSGNHDYGQWLKDQLKK